MYDITFGSITDLDPHLDEFVHDIFPAYVPRWGTNSSILSNLLKIFILEIRRQFDGKTLWKE